MKINLEIEGKDKEDKEVNLQLKRDSESDTDIKVSIGYQDTVVNLEDLEKAIKYIKGNNQNEKI